MSAAQKHVEVRPILSRGWDVFFAGGLSVAIYLLMSVSFRSIAPDLNVAIFVFNLSFVINFPHFLASYQLLYGDFGRHIFRDWRFFGAGVVVPVVLAGGMLAGFATSSPHLLGYFLNAMYFFVGWHYVKQTFGAIVVTNAMKNMFYTPTERRWLQANMYALWAVSVAAMNQGFQVFSQMGLRYYSLEFPGWTLAIANCALVVSVTGVLWTHSQKYVREGKIPSATAMVSYFTIYLWLLPLMTHAMYAHMIPAFHSLQYLLFVYAFKANKTESEIANPASAEGRRHRLFGLWGFYLGSVLLGALAFYLVPTFIEDFGFINKTMFGATPAAFFVTVFINIHHYFIDSVIWRGNNTEIRQHLFHVNNASAPEPDSYRHREVS